MRATPTPLTSGAVAVTVAVAALTAWMWSTPVDRVVASPDRGQFTITYSNLAAADVAHGPDGIAFGEPVFLSLAHHVEITAVWAGATTDDARLELSMTVSSSAGWSRRFGDVRSVAVAGGERSISAPLDLGEAWRLARELDVLTGTSGSVQVTATAELRDAVAVLAHATLALDLTATTAQPASPPVSGGPGPAGGGAPADRVAIDIAERLTREPRQLTLGPFALERSTARPALTATTAVAASCAAVVGGVSRRRRRCSPALDARVRHGRSMVRAVAVTGSPMCTVDVTDIDELARVARDLALPLVAVPVGDVVVHQVIDGNTVYRFLASMQANTT